MMVFCLPFLFSPVSGENENNLAVLRVIFPLQFRKKDNAMNKNENKSQSEQNPMEDSDYCYQQTLGKALVGFAKALELRQGRITSVTNEDIFDYCDVDKEEYHFLFETPAGLYAAVQKEIQTLFSDAVKMLEDMDIDLKLASIFKRLERNSPMVTVVSLAGDHKIWRDSMKDFVAGIAEGWSLPDSPEWDYLYRNFCCQFALILEKWRSLNYSEDAIPDLVRLTKIWLDADGMIGETAEDLIK